MSRLHSAEPLCQIGYRHRRRGLETRPVLSDAPPARDEILLRNVALGHIWFEKVKVGQTYQDIATAAGVSKRRLMQLVDLAFLAPDIVGRILDGRHPTGLSSDSIARRVVDTFFPKNSLVSASGSKRTFAAINPKASHGPAALISLRTSANHFNQRLGPSFGAFPAPETAPSSMKHCKGTVWLGWWNSNLRKDRQRVCCGLLAGGATVGAYSESEMTAIVKYWIQVRPNLYRFSESQCRPTSRSTAIVWCSRSFPWPTFLFLTSWRRWLLMLDF